MVSARDTATPGLQWLFLRGPRGKGTPGPQRLFLLGPQDSNTGAVQIVLKGREEPRPLQLSCVLSFPASVPSSFSW